MNEEDLRSGFEQLTAGFSEMMSESMPVEGVAEATSEKLQQIVQDFNNSQKREIAVAEQLLNSIQNIDNAGTANMTAEVLIQQPELIEELENPEQNIAEMEALTGEISNYISEVNTIQNQFSAGVVTRADAAKKLNMYHQRTVETLREEHSELGLQEDTAKNLISRFDQLESAQSEYMNAQSESLILASTQEQLDEVQEEFESTFNQMTAPLEAAVRDVNGRLTGTNIIIAGLAATAFKFFDVFEDADEAVSMINQNLALPQERLNEMYSVFTGLRIEAAQAGVEINDLGAALGVMVEEFGTIENYSNYINENFRGVQDPVEAVQRETLATADALNMSVEESAKVMKNVTTLAHMTGETRANITSAALSLSNQFGMSANKLMSAISENAEDLAIFSSGSAEDMAAAAAEAERLGTNLENSLEAQRGILSDVSGFVQSTAEVEMFTGLRIDSEDLINAASEGTGEFMQEFNSQLQGADFDNMLQGMNALQKMKLNEYFKSIGTSVSDVSERMSILEHRNETLGMTHEQLAEYAREQSMSYSELMNQMGKDTVYDELGRNISALSASFSEIFAPAVRGTAQGLSFFVSVLNNAVEKINWLLDGISTGVDTLLSFTGASEKTQATMSSLGGGILAVSFAAAVLYQTIGGLISLLGNLGGLAGSLFTGSGGLFGTINRFLFGGDGNQDAFTRLFSWVREKVFDFIDFLDEFATKVGDLFETIIDSIISVFEKLFDKLSELTDSVSKFLNSIIELVTSAFTTLMEGLGKAFSAFFETMRNVPVAAIAKGAAILGVLTVASIGLAAALWIAEPAIDTIMKRLNEFTGILVNGFIDLIGQLSNSFENLVDDFIMLGQNAGSILKAAAALYALAPALMAVSTAIASSAIMNAGSGLVNNIFGGGLLDKLEILANKSDPLLKTASSIQLIASSLKELESVDVQASVNSVVNVSDQITDGVDLGQLNIIRDAMASQISITDDLSDISSTNANVLGESESLEPRAAVKNSEGPQSRAQDSETLDELRRIAENQEAMLSFLENNGLDVYMDNTKVTNELRKHNSNNSLK